MEARHQKNYDIDEFHRRFASELADGRVSGSVQLTCGNGGLRMLCTSVEPGTGAEFETLRKELAVYDCATVIPDPSEFTLPLVKDFGLQHGEEAVRSNAMAMVHLARIAVGFIKAGAPVPEAVVDVRHGQVVYSDEPSEVLERYPQHNRAMVLPFVKRMKFAGEREYRFTLSLGSEPKRQRIAKEATDVCRNFGQSAMSRRSPLERITRGEALQRHTMERRCWV